MKGYNEIFLTFLLVQMSCGVCSWKQPKFATPGQFPYQASLVWVGPPEISHFHSCGGAVVSEFWIVSSGYCLLNIPNTDRIIVKVGSHNISNDNEYVQKREVELFIIHEKYTRNQAMRSLAPYDIGLIKLKKALVFNNYVRLIKLPTPDGLFSGKVELNYSVVISGWGLASYGASLKQDEILRFVTVNMISNEVCQNSIKGDFHWIDLQDSQICTGPLDGSPPACVGDYGGPLVQYDNTNVPELVGILTWNMMPCNTVRIPPIYARVPYFVKWIKKKMKTN